MRKFTKYYLYLFSLLYPSLANSTPLTSGELGIYYANQNIKGWIETKGDNSKIDLNDDLGYDNKGSFFIKLKVRHGLSNPFVPNFYLDYTKVDFSGYGNIAGTKTYAGKNLTGNVYSEVSLNHYDFTFPITFTATDKMRMDLGLTIRYIDYKSKIRDANNTAQKDENIYLPMVYMLLEFNPSDFLSFLFEEKFIAYNDNNISDLNVEARFKPINLGVASPYISVGYRYEVFSFDDIKNLKSAITINQPYIGLGVSF